MISSERQQKILDMMQKKKIIKISDITSNFGVSTETARRDIHILASQNLCKKIYGGASLISPISFEPSYSTREIMNRAEKIAIGKKAAELVVENKTIILDVGTTIIELARSIKNKGNVIVLTNSLSIVNELTNTDINLHIMGGKLNPSFLTMSGSLTLSALKQFFVDIAFIGAGGVTVEDGISDYNIEEAQVRRFSIERASKTVLLADSSKFGINAFAMVCPLEKIDTIITDWKIDPKVLESLREMKIEVLIADKPDGV